MINRVTCCVVLTSLCVCKGLDSKVWSGPGPRSHLVRHLSSFQNEVDQYKICNLCMPIAFGVPMIKTFNVLGRVHVTIYLHLRSYL